MVGTGTIQAPLPREKKVRLILTNHAGASAFAYFLESWLEQPEKMAEVMTELVRSMRDPGRGDVGNPPPGDYSNG